MITPILTFDDPRKYPPLLRLRRGLERPDVRRVMGRSIAGALRRHFSKLDGQRANRLGGSRTHFYGAARRAVQQPQLIGGDGVVVSVNHLGIAQRYYGGTITPKTAKALTLPVHPDAYGHRAREFSDLQFIPSRRPGVFGILARPNPDSPTGIGEAYYVLVKRVTQAPDPTVLPDFRTLEQTALEAADAYVRTTARTLS
jgi:hypothetical protein